MVYANREFRAFSRLDEIEAEIARQLRDGKLFPERRAEAATAVVTLYDEAVEISRAPHEYQPPEPWQIDEPQQRDEATRRMVVRVFRDAPQDDPLTEALVDLWTAQLQDCAERRDLRAYERQCAQMREDAQVAREARTEPCPLTDPEPPPDAGVMLDQLAVLSEATRVRLVERSGKKPGTWQRAGVQALESLEATIRWMRSQSTVRKGGSRNAIATSEALQLARRFNVIRHAISRRCR